MIENNNNPATKLSLSRIFWSKLTIALALSAIVYYSQDKEFANLESFVFLIPFTYLFLFYVRWLYSAFSKIARLRSKIFLYLLVTIAIYFIQRLSDKSSSWFWQLVTNISQPMFGALIFLPFWGIFKSRNLILLRMNSVWPTALLFRIIKILFNWKSIVILYIVFWYSFSKHPFNLEETNNLFVIISFFYFPLAIFSVIIRFLHRISRFYSIPISILGALAAPIVFYLTSPDMNPSVSFADQYRYFFSLAVPLGIASIITLIISVPAYFRLIFKKPQYFMFSFFLLLSFVYIFTVEYRQYGQLNGYKKFFCSYQNTKDTISPKVVRIMGSYTEGSGFFVSENLVVTNRHVVKGEDYPKIVLPTGEFLTPVKVELSEYFDIAFLKTDIPEPGYVVNTNKEAQLSSGEEALSFGYALGSDIKGTPTILPLRFENNRNLASDGTDYLQFSSAIVDGMSGGPVFDKCGDFVGVNVMSTSGTSLIISGESLKNANYFSKEEPKKIKLEPGATPEASVYAYYYLLKARDTKGCYGLLSQSYKTRSTYEEWTARFPNVISVEVFYVKEIKSNLVYVMFGMTEWVGGERVAKLYEGTWETVKEGDAYHLSRSYIVELESYYDSKGPDSFLNNK